MNALTIGASRIHQLDGLYSLNDLHVASGGNPAHRPSQYSPNGPDASSDPGNSKCAEIPAFKTQRGANGGTYAYRELVIAYAAWISPSFRLQVIRVFLATKPQSPALPAPSFDWGAEIEAANFDQKEPLPPEVQTAIDARAWALMPGVHALLRRHIERRVAGNLKRAFEVIEQTSLSSAIAPAHHQEIETALDILDMMVGVTQNARREMYGLSQRETMP